MTPVYKVMVISVGALLTVQAQEHLPPVDRPMQSDITLSDSSKTDAFVAILGTNTIAGGVVGFRHCEEPRFDRSFPSGTTPRQALDALVSQEDTASKWLIVGDLVNVLPARGLPELLRVRIDLLEIRDVRRASVDPLLTHPAVAAKIKELGFNYRQPEIGYSWICRPGSPCPVVEPVSVLLQDVTLLEALNGIASANGAAVWAYEERHCEGQQPRLYLDFRRR